jgi:hypothetical protein
MRNETIDWADVAAVGLIADVLSTSASRGPVASLLEDLRREWCRDFRGGFTRDVGKAASALREAFEAGQRESGNLYTEHSLALDRLLEQAEELAALRRELAARRAVDRWLRAASCRSLRVTDWGELFATTWDDGRERRNARAPDYPALAAALGLEVGVEDD